jgi:hypothetical protein
MSQPYSDPRGLLPDVPEDLLTPSSIGDGGPSIEERAEAALSHLQVKMESAMVEFAQGRVNQAQFEAIYTRYSRQQALIETLLSSTPSTSDLEQVAKSGITAALRQEYGGTLEGMLVIETHTCQSLKTFGAFSLPNELLTPLLDGFKTLDAEAISEEAKITMIDGGRWLGVFPGEQSCAMTVFSREPAQQLVRQIAAVQRDFEKLNRAQLEPGPADPARMVYPQVSLFPR